ncbi:MAG: acyltransferase family protein [Lachnospiraceae bacterium]
MMEKKYGFTKENTLAIKGIAICFLICYHCFSQEFRLLGREVNFWPFSKEVGMEICFNMVICVGMFSFLSVYGLVLSMKKRFPGYTYSNREALCYVVERYMKIVFMFLLPFIFCQTVTEIMDLSRYEGGPVIKFISMALDGLCVSNIFGSKMLVDTWWYLSLVVIITVFMPFCIQAYKRFGWLIIPMALIIGSFFLKRNVNLTKWMFTIPIAVCFADRQVLERLKAWQIGPNRIVSKMIKFVSMTVVLLLMCKLRTGDWGRAHLEFLMNGIVPVFFIWWSYEFVIEIPGLKQVLQFMGKHSATIFYVHTLVRWMWLRDLTYSFGYAILIWLFVFFVSLAISIFLNVVAKVIRYDKMTGAAIRYVCGWIMNCPAFEDAEDTQKQ